MAAPSKPYTLIPDTDIDPDSPITTGLMEDIRDDLIHLEEWLGFSYTAAQDHDHDGVNSAPVVLTGNALKRAQGTFNVTDTNPDFDVSTGFEPRIAWAAWIQDNYPDGGTSTNSYSWGFAIGTGTGATAIGFGDFDINDQGTDSDAIGAASVDGSTGIASGFLNDLNVTQFDSTRVRVEPASALSASRDWGGIMVVLGTAS